MNYLPGPGYDSEVDEIPKTKVSLTLTIPCGKIVGTIGLYPVVVEMWHRCVGRGSSGRHRRAFQDEFTESERRRARRFYNIFRRWYLISGPPQVWTCRVATVKFARRLINFFGTV